MMARLLIGLALFVVPALEAQVCLHPRGAPRLDHVVVVASDLEGMASQFSALGFTIKPGRIHPDGLINDHVKLADGHEIELMTVSGAASGPTADGYGRLLGEGEGGAYIGLMVDNLNRVRMTTDGLRLATERSQSGPWRFLAPTFESGAGTLFFGEDELDAHDPAWITDHPNGATGLLQVWTEGDRPLTDLLSALGASRCGYAISPDGRSGEVWGLATGEIAVVPPRDPTRLPRVLGAVLSRKIDDGPATFDLPGFWIQFRSGAGPGH